MSDVMAEAEAALKAKLADADIGGTVKFDIEGEGAIMVDDGGVRQGDDAADVTLKADADTFREILDGSLNPTAAFMGGKLTVDGDMGLAMKLASELG
ncbi:SCP2 sterol-binding domain-containing protein [Pseudaestuariivita atlantica]|uniref:Sterol carrier family protein n=1 Tax=Pseudaestuariivita atlantica TaxID=1317121 RepID=A0A0L1JQE2_9RHOB|nr:SCP2 sterol-binding domain-containing protein [Pseudaestuariivita atlantica]KNG93994.1 sterol carrier family protein [Pseudaestuariivita atlantica]